MDGGITHDVVVKQELINDHFKVEKKKRTIDRFNGTPKEELMKRSLPDHIKHGLDILIIGINPSLIAAYKQRYYASAGNHFWKCLFLSGLIPEPMTSEDDSRLLEFGIGFTDIVKRTTPCSSDLSRSEIRDGASVLLNKIQQFRPRIAVFNGKGIYEIFVSCFPGAATAGASVGSNVGGLGGVGSFCGIGTSTRKQQLVIGKQPHCIPNTDTYIFVMPSSSARCAQLPRAVDKVPIFAALKKFRDHLRGDPASTPPLPEDELVFPDLELISAPVEPEARAQFIRDKRAKEEAKRAERERVKKEKIERGEMPKPRAPKRKINAIESSAGGGGGGDGAPDVKLQSHPNTTTAMTTSNGAIIAAATQPGAVSTAAGAGASSSSPAATAAARPHHPGVGTFRELSLALPCEEKQGYDVQKWVDSHNFGKDPDDDEEDFHLENGVHIEFKYDLKPPLQPQQQQQQQRNSSSLGSHIIIKNSTSNSTTTPMTPPTTTTTIVAAEKNSDSSHSQSTKTVKPTTISNSSGYVSYLAENKGSPDDPNLRLGLLVAAGGGGGAGGGVNVNSKTFLPPRSVPSLPQLQQQQLQLQQQQIQQQQHLQHHQSKPAAAAPPAITMHHRQQQKLPQPPTPPQPQQQRQSTSHSLTSFSPVMTNLALPQSSGANSLLNGANSLLSGANSTFLRQPHHLLQQIQQQQQPQQHLRGQQQQHPPQQSVTQHPQQQQQQHALQQNQLQHYSLSTIGGATAALTASAAAAIKREPAAAAQQLQFLTTHHHQQQPLQQQQHSPHQRQQPQPPVVGNATTHINIAAATAGTNFLSATNFATPIWAAAAAAAASSSSSTPAAATPVGGAQHPRPGDPVILETLAIAPTSSIKQEPLLHQQQGELNRLNAAATTSGAGGVGSTAQVSARLSTAPVSVAQLSLLHSPIRVDSRQHAAAAAAAAVASGGGAAGGQVTYPLYLLPGHYASLSADMMVARQHGHHLQLATQAAPK